MTAPDPVLQTVLTLGTFWLAVYALAHWLKRPRRPQRQLAIMRKVAVVVVVLSVASLAGVVYVAINL